jgi:DNA repair protein RadA/Sms
VRGRAARMGLAEAPVKLAAETALRDIMDGLKREHFDLVVIDSIQTMWSDAHEAGPGSVTQVRNCASELVRLAKKRGVAVSSSATSPRTARSPARALWSTWSTRC